MCSYSSGSTIVVPLTAFLGHTPRSSAPVPMLQQLRGAWESDKSRLEKTRTFAIECWLHLVRSSESRPLAPNNGHARQVFDTSEALYIC